MPELQTARENTRLEIGSQRVAERNSHQINVLGIYDLQGLSFGRTELLVADMRLLAPDPSGTPRVGRCHSTAICGVSWRRGEARLEKLTLGVASGKCATLVAPQGGA